MRSSEKPVRDYRNPVVFLLMFGIPLLSNADPVAFKFYGPNFNGRKLFTYPHSTAGTYSDFIVNAELSRFGTSLMATFESPIEFSIDDDGFTTEVLIDRLLIPRGKTADQIERLAPLTDDHVVLYETDIAQPDLERQEEFRSKIRKVDRAGSTLYEVDGKLFTLAEIGFLSQITKLVAIQHPFKLGPILLDNVDFAEASGGVITYEGEIRSMLTAIYTADGAISYRGESRSIQLSAEEILKRPRLPLNDPAVREKVSFLRNQILGQQKRIDNSVNRILRENGISDGGMSTSNEFCPFAIATGLAGTFLTTKPQVKPKRRSLQFSIIEF